MVSIIILTTWFFCGYLAILHDRYRHIRKYGIINKYYLPLFVAGPVGLFVSFLP